MQRRSTIFYAMFTVFTVFRFRETILARGGAISMRDLFREFRSRDPSHDHYIKQLTTQF